MIGAMTEEEIRVASETRSENAKARKPKNRPECTVLIDNLRRDVPDSHQSKVESMNNGSLKAAVSLHCLQCVDYSMSEVRACSSKMCPMWPFRPYQ